MRFTDAVKHCLSNYARFEGRAARSEFWWFVLFSIIVSMAASMVDRHGTVGTLAALALVVPQFAVGSRRLHDVGRSGWWQLLYLLPIIGGIVLLVWFVTAGSSQSNEYGPPVIVAGEPLRVSAPPAGPAAPSAAPHTADIANQLAELERLRQEGVLTQQEFERAKARVLGAG